MAGMQSHAGMEAPKHPSAMKGRPHPIDIQHRHGVCAYIQRRPVLIHLADHTAKLRQSLLIGCLESFMLSGIQFGCQAVKYECHLRWSKKYSVGEINDFMNHPVIGFDIP